YPLCLETLGFPLFLKYQVSCDVEPLMATREL
ncbi:hypothetical protein A2U01_0070680, partial [Trifolium medium]|nr:hypothetical protein [Trifolium medium]